MKNPGRQVGAAVLLGLWLMAQAGTVAYGAEDVGFCVDGTVSAQAKAVDAGEMVIPFQMKNLSVAVDPDGVARFEGLPGTGIPGRPALPVQTVKVLLPPDARVGEVTVELSRLMVRELDGEWDVPPAPPFGTSEGGTAWPDGSTMVDGRDVSVYSSDALYPEAWDGELISGASRDWKVLSVVMVPYRYNPVTKRLQQLESGELIVRYPLASGRKVRTAKAPATEKRAGADARRRSEVMSMVVNPEMTDPYEAVFKADTPEAPSASPADLVIVTTSSIQSQSTNWAAYIAAKEALGFAVHVVVEGVSEDDDHYITGTTSDMRADHIRSWLENHYASMGIEYVLLIGNPHPTTFSSSSSVPMKMCWPRNSQTTYKNAPTDMYFAELTGNWDHNANGVYGEEDDLGTGGIDMMCEVSVGRIPVYDTGTTQIGYLDSILAKTMAYEASGDRTWRSNLLGSASFQDDGFVCDGAEMIEQFKTNVCADSGWGSQVLYQQGSKNASCDSDYLSDYELRGTSYGTDDNHHHWQWQNGEYGLVLWWGHGASTWTQVGPNNASDGTLFSYSHAPGLDDDHPSFLFPNSCNNGYPETVNNLCVSVLRNGCIGVLSPSRVTWYAVSKWSTTKFAYYSDNASCCYNASRRMIVEEECIGDAVNWVHANGGLSWSSGSSFMNHLDFNIYGDPTVGFTTGGSDIPATITGDPQSRTNHPGTAASFTVTAAGTAPMSFQWQMDGADLVSETSTTYVIASVAAMDAGDYRCRVSNALNVATSDVATLTVLPAPPASVWASETNAADFTAAWSAVTGAGSYRLDVSTNADFMGTSGPGGVQLGETFDSGLAGSYTTGNQTLTSGVWYTSAVYPEASGDSRGGSAHAARLNDDTTGACLRTPALNTVGAVTFWYRELNSGGGTFRLQKSYDGSAWVDVDTQSFSGTTYVQYSNTVDDAAAMVYVRVLNDHQDGHLIVDDFEVTAYGSSAPDTVTGYSNRTVSATSQSVTGLTASSEYYFRVRAVSGDGISLHSPTGSVTTTAGRADQILTFPSISDQLTTATVTLSATASSGLPVHFAVSSGAASISGGTSLSFTAAGAVRIVASQAGDASWNPASSVTNSFMVNMASAAVTLSDLWHLVDGSPKNATVTTVPDGLSVSTTYDGSGTVPSAEGSYAVFAQVSDALYSGSASDTMEIVSVTNVFEEWVEDQGEDPVDPDYAPDEDIDGDGATTWEEFLADTDPAESNSVLSLSGSYFIASQASNVTGHICFSFPASTSRFYQLESCTGLTNHLVGATNLGWGVPGMVVTNDATGTWYGVIRALLQEP